MQDFSTFLKGKPTLPSLWTGNLNFAKLNPIPHRYRPSRAKRNQKKRASGNYTGAEDVTSLQKSLNPLDTLRKLQNHKWRLLDLQYTILVALIIFSLCITPSAPLIKTLAVTGGLLLLTIPVTSQFFFPGLSIWAYLIYFFCSRFIDAKYRPHIWVRVLPALENVLYGANLSNILSAHTHPVLDILAWIPYGLGHFGAPFICAGFLFLFAAPKTLPIFAKCFGWLNVLGVTIQLVFPCTPPWYENEHGLAPAAYGMSGSPAGLARIDAILGIDMYTTSFSTAPVPFGAFPSLHAADAVIEALILSYCFPRFRPLFVIYVGWIWWATMYLNHHYAVDLVGGSLLSAGIFYFAKARYLPQQQADKKTRWEYDYVEIGEQTKVFDEEYGRMYNMGYLQRRGSSDSDEWTVGSSSSYSTSSRGSGSLSPALSEESGRSIFSIEIRPDNDRYEIPQLTEVAVQ
ncbi:PAP2 superfamily protein [Colletotrichum filicis]|nr:PAP2 superfamily protein [Colletotrichum filicis]